MKLLKLLAFIFLIYFIRRFIQMYRALKKIQLQEGQELKKESYSQETKNSNVVEADYKVVD